MASATSCSHLPPLRARALSLPISLASCRAQKYKWPASLGCPHRSHTPLLAHSPQYSPTGSHSHLLFYTHEHTQERYLFIVRFTLPDIANMISIAYFTCAARKWAVRLPTSCFPASPLRPISLRSPIQSRCYPPPPCLFRCSFSHSISS